MTTIKEILIDPEFRQRIPPLQPEERSQLETSLKIKGNVIPVVIWKETGILLDGHNRRDICIATGIPLKPPLELSFPDRESAMVWMIDNQLGRRNISSYSRTVLALAKEEILRKRADANLVTSTGGVHPQPLATLPKVAIDTRHEVAKIADVGDRTVDKVKLIQEKATPEQKLKLMKGEATINQIFVSVHRDEVRENIKTAVFPTGKYRVIYADPPWGYNNSMPVSVGVQDDHYPTMPVDEICKLRIVDLAMDDAVLFLWATSPILREAFQVIEAWGFQYKANFVWDKTRGIMGHYGNNVCHEHLLIAVRGSCHPEVDKLFDTVQTIERTEHSAKPEEFRNIIDTLYPHGNRIELFARKKVEGWERFGNQLPDETVSENKDNASDQ
jgi:N6-adenosine-specific RNA methylase IME4